MEPLPYDITELMVQCFGKCFHYKDGMTSFLMAAGVDRALVDKYRHEAKYVWSRHVLTELGQSQGGRLTQRKVLLELCKLRDIPDPNVPDRDTALDALRKLKELALERDIIARKERQKGEDSRRLAEEKARVVSDRADKLEALRRKFSAGVVDPDRQAAGYSLEDMLRDLFGLFEIEYRKSYRTDTQQIDGHFAFQSFDFLVEAKWRREQPTEKDIGGFKHEVDTKFESTRGVFVSVPGFRSEVIDQFNGRGANIILMDGADLSYILEGRIDLRDALRLKIERASQKGIVFTPLYGQ